MQCQNKFITYFPFFNFKCDCCQTEQSITMPCSVLVAFKGIARRAWGRPLAARGWWAQTSQKVNFAYCTDHRPVQPSHIESAVNQLCFMKPSTLIYVCLFSSSHSCKQGPSLELSSSVPVHAVCQGSVNSESLSSLTHLELPFPDKHLKPLAYRSQACEIFWKCQKFLRSLT